MKKAAQLDELWKRKGLKGKEKPLSKGCAFPFLFYLLNSLFITTRFNFRVKTSLRVFLRKLAGPACCVLTQHPVAILQGVYLPTLQKQLDP
jgi:hypothetical protein